MAKTFILSNTYFGWKNNDRDILDMMLKYFYSYLVPFLNQHFKEDDQLVLTGNIFSGQNINIVIYKEVCELIEKLSSLVPLTIEGKYGLFFKHFPNITFSDKKYTNYIVDSLYPLKKGQNKVGFIVVDENNKSKFFENDYSPKYETIIIDNIDEIENLDKDYINQNHIDLELTENVIGSKLKLDMLLSQYNFKKVIYPKDVKEDVVINEDTFNVSELIKEHIENSDNSELLLKEFNKIVDLYKTRY